MGQEVVDPTRKPAEGPRLDVRSVRRIACEIQAACDPDGRASESLGRYLQALDRDRRFSPAARAAFEDLLARVGVASIHPPGLPLDSQPFWLRGAHPFATFRSTAEPPQSADIVIVGAGLTGASAAYHLTDAVRSLGLRVVVLERGEPAGEASGRNGGNFQLIPENTVGVYEGLARERLLFLRKRYPGVAREVLQAESERQASVVLGLALRNRDRLRNIVRLEGIACDLSPRGWLYLAHNEREEGGICDEVTLAAQHGERIEIWSRQRIREQFGFRTAYLGRFIPGDGTYHPFKYVCGLLQRAVSAGVELYTHVAVRSITSDGADRHRLELAGEAIVARRVIVATNAFTPQVLPELSAIQPYQSQIMLTEHVPDRTRGRVVTSEYGPVFFNQPRAGLAHGRAPLLMGGGPDRPMRNPTSRRRSPSVHRQLLQLRDDFFPELHGQPPSAEWIGPMGFTPDQLPAIGFLRPGVVVAAGFNGYGGSYTTAADEAAASMALTDEVPDWVPSDVFSPLRLASDEPLFLGAQESLWRIAESLCRQLRAVERHQFAETISFLPETEKPRAVHTSAPSQPAAPVGVRQSTPASREAELLKTLSTFRHFTLDELSELVRLMRRWELPKGTLVFAEGAPGGTCMVVVSVAVDVSASVDGRQRVLATMQPGSIFGQVSLIDSAPRSATCTVRRDATLLELERGPCERLFASRSSTALKFLAALNHGLIVALRGADHRLMRVTDRRAPNQAALGSTAGGGAWLFESALR
jgi:glycine/D-amino acid oxidase-like deaminating enzyme/CRP-like cAMP-binding protein